jgi:L-fuculose-phosphate aldolase
MMAGRRVAEHELRQEMVRIGRLMWERGYVAATDGNLSARLDNERLLVTATGHSKGFLSVDDLVILNLEGEPVASYRGRGQRPSSEILMHLEVYQQRPDVAAIVHAHPPVATAFSIAGVSLARCVLPEVVVSLGSIPTAEYATPGTTEVTMSIREAVRDHDALILAHHGSLTVGETLWEAYLRLEKVEHTAQITLVAQQLGQVRTLSPQAVDQLVQKRQQLLREQGRDVCADCDVCVLDEGCALPAQGAGGGPPEEEALVRQISRAVLNNLEGGAARQ